VPYEVSFIKQVPVVDREQYINECCVGGDVVVDQLLPSVRASYAGIQTNQEDWGWFIWFNKGNVRLAIDVFTDDPEKGQFRIHLTSRTKRLFLVETVVDTSELEEFRTLVESELKAWGANAIKSAHLDCNYME
jgi:hypothetical protein